MKNLKENKGITLVALIITIIVLLILAVVAISAVQGDGIISKAKLARKNYQEAQDEENTVLAGYQATLDSINNEGNGGGSSSGELKAYAEASKDGSGFLTENARYTDKENATATIPAGFKVSDEEGEQTISTGLVIKDSESNEFVWVPVPDITKMAKLKDGSSTNYEGILYDIDNDEPDTLFDDGNTTYLEKAGITESKNQNETYFKNQLQTEFNSMVASVSKYKGFYVARYELSTTAQGKLASKAGATVTTAYTNDNMWYGLYNISKTYNTNSVQSNMIYGCQYDAMMNWMDEEGLWVGSSSGGSSGSSGSSGSGESAIVPNASNTYTGQPGDEDILNNVYDLEGGHFEWTQEAKDSYRVQRGGYYNGSHIASYRSSASVYGDWDSSSARSALYIK